MLNVLFGVILCVLGFLNIYFFMTDNNYIFNLVVGISSSFLGGIYLSGGFD